MFLMKISEQLLKAIHPTLPSTTNWQDWCEIRDALLDEGDPLADTVEWMIENRNRPYTGEFKDKPLFIWFRKIHELYVGYEQDPESDLDTRLYNTLKNFNSGYMTLNQKGFNSMEEAVRSLHEVLKEISDAGQRQ